MGMYFIYNKFNFSLCLMDWEKRIKELSNYDISFEIKQGYYHIAIKYDEGWNILSPENEAIYLEERNGIYHYIASTDSVKIEDIFNVIDSTIEYNLDLQKKLILFKQKTEELQQLFSNEDYDVLQTIEFTLKKKKETKKTKSKVNKKEKTAKKTKAKKEKKKVSVDETKTQETENEVSKEFLEITSVDAPNYDNEEVVTMKEPLEELERE